MSEAFAFFILFVALLFIAAALWIAGAPEIEVREHLRIRDEINGGRLRVLEDVPELEDMRDAA